MSIGDDHTYRLIGKGIVRIKKYDGTMRKLKNVRYIPCITKNLISIRALEAEGLKETLGEDTLKMSSGSLVVLKGITRNVYYLMGSAVTELASSE